MKATRILKAFATAGKQVQLVGDLDAGVIVALDLEGRLFTVLDGEVLNRVNLDAIAGESTQKLYLNPGGDGLWPAPEGTSLGYQYSTGAWRVTPGLACRALLGNQSRQTQRRSRRRSGFDQRPRAWHPNPFQAADHRDSGQAVGHRADGGKHHLPRARASAADGLPVGSVDALPVRQWPGMRGRVSLHAKSGRLGSVRRPKRCAARVARPPVPNCDQRFAAVPDRHRRASAVDRIPRPSARPVGAPQGRSAPRRSIVYRHPRCGARTWRRPGRVSATAFTATPPTSWRSKRSAAARRSSARMSR